MFPGVSPIGFVSLRTNFASAHYWSIAKGAGVGMLPTYAQAIGAQLVPLDMGVVHPIDIWMTYHPDAKRIPRVKRTIEWIIQSFDPQRFPWFRDEFIHPDKLVGNLQGRASGEFAFCRYPAPLAMNEAAPTPPIPARRLSAPRLTNPAELRIRTGHHTPSIIALKSRMKVSMAWGVKRPAL